MTTCYTYKKARLIQSTSKTLFLTFSERTLNKSRSCPSFSRRGTSTDALGTAGKYEKSSSLSYFFNDAIMFSFRPITA